MKVAVSAMGRDLDSKINPHFGRCSYFLIVETEDMSFEVFDNENGASGSGAGIQAAQFLTSKGAAVVITGNCGPNAVRTLSAAGVKLFVGQSGTVKQAVEGYKNNELRPTLEANVLGHYKTRAMEPVRDTRGQGFGRGMGMGRGMGRGRGMGGARGIGPGVGMLEQNASNQTSNDNLSKEQDLRSLKEQAVNLRKQMEETEKRINQLEKGS